MGYPLFHLRTIVEDDLFCERLREVESDPMKADVIVDGVKTRLCNDPGSGVLISTRIWVTFVRKSSLSPELAVYYAFDENRVILLDLRLAEGDDDW